MASKAIVSLQVPAANSQEADKARAHVENTWSCKRFPKERNLQISIPEPDQRQAYPADAVKVHNTFIHVASPTPASLERFVQSCPSSQIGCLKGEFAEEKTSGAKQILCLEEVLFEAPMPSTPEAVQVSGMGMNAPAAYSLTPGKLRDVAFPGPALQVPGNFWPMPPQQLEAYPQQMEPGQLGNVLQPPIFSEVAEAMPPMPVQPAPGTAELPSVGSKDHITGECKPCAFLHVRGCDNGAMCKFCHLCDAGEKKRRQKAKKAAFRGGA